MLLSLDGCRSDCRPVRGGIIARRIGGTGDVAECPSHAAAAPVPGSPASATPSAVRGMIVSAALRLSDRNKRCTIVCCGGPNVVRRGDRELPAQSDGARPPASARCRRGADRASMAFSCAFCMACVYAEMMRCSPRCTSLPSPFANAAAFVAGADGLAAAASLPARAATRVPSSV
jgi:hypothetical protein